jgi:presenilin-like A22 family membrane protease
MQLKINLFSKELLLFGSTLLLGLVVAYRYANLSSAAPIIQTPEFSLWDLIIFVSIIAIFLIVTRFKPIARIVLWVFLSIIIFSGTQIIISVFAPYPWNLIGGLIVLLIFLLIKNVLVHDLGIILALAGVGAVLGSSITPSFAIIALIILSFYDIIAVYKTHHMVRMAEGMVQTGAIFGFIIPSELKSFTVKRSEAKTQIGEQFMVLGSGDIGLPIIFIASLMRQSLGEAIIVALFALIGVSLTHFLFVNQRKRQAMAALPPIATSMLIGYLISLYFI